MSILDVFKVKPLPSNCLNDFLYTPCKERKTTSTLSTQCEDKPKPSKQINFFNNAIKGKVQSAHQYAKKQIKLTEQPIEIRNQPIGSAFSLKDTPLKSQSNVNSSNFIPLLKYSTSSIDNVSKLITSGSLSTLSPIPKKDDYSCLNHSESLTNLKKSNIMKQLFLNDQQCIPGINNKNKGVCTEESNSNSNNTKATSTLSPYIQKSSSYRNLPGKGLRIDNISSSSIQLQIQQAYVALPHTVIENKILINYDDLLLIEDKLQDILTSIENKFTVSHECFEWWNYYFSSNIPYHLEEFFNTSSNKNKINSFIKIELLCIMVCYSLSSDNLQYLNHADNLKTIISLLHFNLLLVIKCIMTMQKVHDYSYIKLDMMIKKSLTHIQEKDVDEFFIISLMNHNMMTVTTLYQNIIDQEFQATDQRKLNYFFSYAFQNKEALPIEEYNEFFRFNLVQVTNKEGSVLASSLGANPIPIKLKLPYLPIMIHFKYSVVLDLDETLFHVQENQDPAKKMKLMLRPGLIPFLQKMKSRFELIAFTVGTKKYADNILNALEAKEQYFDYRLYRHHTTVIENDFIKDLNKLGRDIARIIIIDNMPQNFRLQKENGIFIKPYYGDNKNDTALHYLTEILFKISNDNNDVRKGIAKYKNEIITKVSLNKLP